MLSRFYTLLDDGKVLPFLFDRIPPISKDRISIEEPIVLAVPPVDGMIQCFQADVSQGRFWVSSGVPFSGWSVAHELLLDGSANGRIVVPDATACGVTPGRLTGTFINTDDGPLLWLRGAEILLPVEPRNGRGIDGFPSRSRWWDTEHVLFLSNSDGDLVILDVPHGKTYELPLRRFGIDPLRSTGESRNLVVVSVEVHGDELTIAWSSRVPIDVAAQPFSDTVVKRCSASGVLAASRRGDDLEMTVIDNFVKNLHGTVLGVCYLPRIDPKDPDEMFLAGFPRGQFRRYTRDSPTPINPNPQWVLADNLDLANYLANRTPPMTTEFARFLQLGPKP